MFIAVDLRVIEGRAAAVARAAGITEDQALAGLVRLWHRAWVEESEKITDAELDGLFSGEKPMGHALANFGFLEATADGFGWRIRGSDRYLRLKKSRREGAAKTNALRASLKHALRAPVSVAPERSSTEHRTPNTETTTKDFAGSPSATPPPLATWVQTFTVAAEKRKARGPKPPPTRLRALTEALALDYFTARGSTYAHGGAKDANALKRLLPIATDDEIRRRWRHGLGASGWASCSTLAQLGAKWNDLAAPTKPGGGTAASSRLMTAEEMANAPNEILGLK